jgi:hypothetical protein
MNYRPESIGGELEPIEASVDANDLALADQFAIVNDGIYSDMELIPSEPEWNRQVNQIIVVLSASRSGSSLVFKALSSSSDVIAPAGEHEPWLFMSGNKYPFTPSDQLPDIQNGTKLLHLLRNDLLVRDEQVGGDEFSNLLWNRLAVRRLHKRGPLDKVVQLARDTPLIDQEVHRRIIDTANKEVGRQKPTAHIGDVRDDSYMLPIENPPYIDQPLARRALIEELGSKALLFKSPPDAYRPGFYESLFPNARITYVHLTRGLVQTVNGLMDGWSKDEVDFISNPVGIEDGDLAIDDYSGSDTTRAYWCFDLFPDWQAYRDAPLIEVCAQQWLQAHRGIVNDFPVEGRVTFESFYTHRRTLYEGIEAATGIDLRGYDWSEEIMATEPPSQFRWLKREQLFRNIRKHLSAATLKDVVEMQDHLGYSMEASTWH